MGLLETTVGWLAPPQCLGCGRDGETICLACSTAEIIPYGGRCFSCSAISESGRTCETCRRHGGPRFVWITSDYEKIAKNLVHTYKFGQQRSAARSIARLMSNTFLSFNGDEEISKLNYLIVPIPTATSRVRQRGFDHSVLLARTISGLVKLEFKPTLIRLGQSRQLGAARHERIRQLSGSYYLRKPETAAGRNILLIDDVVTTGGTLISAAKTLRKAGARRVDALIFAKRL